MLVVLSHNPREWGLEQTRWTLAALLLVMTHCLPVKSEAGMWQVLRRLGIRYRQGWDYMVSPDPLLWLKLAWIEAILSRAQALPGQVVVLWLDEFTFFRQPEPAPAWGDGQTRRGPRTVKTRGANTTARIGAAFNHQTGQLHYLLRSTCGVRQLILLYQTIRVAYPQAQEIYVIQDCWPVHFHPDVARTACCLGMTLVPLPTYSSWRNPIEKLWRWLRQQVLHLHPWADDWPRIRSEVTRFLDRFSLPNTALLRYVGLPY